MQFLWKYIDEILGKGLTILELVELILHYAVTLIPTPCTDNRPHIIGNGFWDMAEKYGTFQYEICRSILLIRIMFPGIVVAFLIGWFSLYFLQ
ncbi:MAG: hypothetical protein IPO98_18260 [Saprospiraceae bacterium]|nr:hypothetical protein [Saprospiraceae bacterium]